MQHEPKWFYDLNIPLAKCKNNITAQRILRTYDTYALKASKGLRLGWRSILRKIWVHRCWKVFSALPQCADRDTKWIFSVDTFTSTRSTHWQNSTKPATRPKVHISRLKVKDQLYEWVMTYCCFMGTLLYKYLVIMVRNIVNKLILTYEKTCFMKFAAITSN